MKKEDKPAFAKTRRMFQMSNWIADNAKLDVTCWTLPPPPRCSRDRALKRSGPLASGAENDRRTRLAAGWENLQKPEVFLQKSD